MIPSVTLGTPISKFITGIPLTTQEKIDLCASLGIALPTAIDSVPSGPGDPRGAVGAFYDDTDENGRFYEKVGLHKWIVSTASNTFE